MSPFAVKIYYKNWKGERAWRTIHPLRMEFASNKWHPEKQWLLIAFDEDKEVERAFAMKGISIWMDT